MTYLWALVTFMDALLDSKKYSPESNGLVVSGVEEVHKIAGAVNLSFSSLQDAVDRQANFLVSHHAAWSSTDANLAEGKYRFAREAGLSVYVAHDSLDRHPSIGTAISLARVLGYDIASLFADGLGVIAIPPVDTSFADFQKHVHDSVNSEALAWPSTVNARRIAIITGWGARPEWMSLAQQAGADTFLSGEAIHFGKLYATEAGLNLILAGHYATEVPGVRSLIEELTREFAIETVFLPDRTSHRLF